MAANMVQLARSFLFVPATRPERFSKAMQSGADCVIIDLEDAVSPDHKSRARDHLAQGLSSLTAAQTARTVVRMNAAGTPWYEDDVQLLRDCLKKGLGAIMLPKAEDPHVMAELASRCRVKSRIIALIESQAGLDQATALARNPGVARLAFGHLDFQLDLGMRCTPEEPEIAYARNGIVAASRRANLPAPIDGVTVDTGNAERLQIDAKRARAFGFSAKLCIHPSQVAGVNAAFSPSVAELEWSRKVIASAAERNGEVFNLDGRMVDLPVVRAALAVIHAQRQFEVTQHS